MGERVLVTGASRGIGRAIAIELASLGHEVVIHYRSRHEEAERTLALVEERGGRGRTLAFDVSDRAACERELGSELEQHGPFWGVVLSAGITADGPFAGLAGEDWDRVLRTNLDGFYNVLRPLVLPMLSLRRGGRIVTLSSVSGLVGNRGQVNYSASKAGIIGATRALAQELAKRGVTVNCIAPGLIDTEMIQGAPVEEFLKAIPMRRLGRPDEVASLAGYLFSERAGYVTGQVISVNGGLA